MGRSGGGALRATWGVALLLALLLISAPGAHGGPYGALKETAVAAAAKPRLSVSILTRGQRTVTRRRSARVAVRSTRSGRHRLTLTLRRRSGGKAVAAGSRTLRLVRGKRRVLVVTLPKRARALLGCRQLVLSATARRTGVRKSTRRTVVLRPDPARCKGAASPGTVNPGPASATDVVVQNPDKCDPIDPAVCLQPWPNNYFTKRDAKTSTQLRLDLKLDAMPRSGMGGSGAGKPIEPADYNASDGFSPGQMITTRVPGLDTLAAFRNTGAVPVDAPQQSLDPNAPVLVINATTKQRHLVWSEIDSNPSDVTKRNLLIRPAVNFAEGTRYIVALRRLKNATGGLLEPRAEFKALRDKLASGNAAVNGRRADMEEIFARLGEAGVARDDLYLAWDFTVASARSTTGRLLSIRDRAFAELGDTNLADRQVQGAPPQFQLNRDFDDNMAEPAELVDPPSPLKPPVGLPKFEDMDGVRNFKRCEEGNVPTCEDGEDPQIARRIRGMFTIPCFLDRPGCPTGARFSFLNAPDEHTPSKLANNSYQQPFICNIPHAAVSGPAVIKARPTLYGHGLFGGLGEVNQGQLKDLANEHNFMPCSTDWDGMATKDVPNAATVLADLSNFPTLIDHVQQGFVNFLYLGRLMIHPQGFSSNEAFKFTKNGASTSAIDTSNLYYDGNSQGGIYGGTLAAIAPDYTRAVLGVPGMNYSTLLRRSVDFDFYAQALYNAYPNELERPLILSLLNVLWDRGDPNGYAQHMTSDPLPNTPPHEVLMHVGFGDHQVADVSAEVQARTIGARGHTPVFEPGRPGYRDRPYPTAFEPRRFAALPSLGQPGYSTPGSGIIFWDIGPPRPGNLGTLPPPAGNVPPRGGQDPHEFPRRTPAARVQKSAFLRPDSESRVIDVCNGGPCLTTGYAGGAPQP